MSWFTPKYSKGRVEVVQRAVDGISAEECLDRPAAAHMVEAREPEVESKAGLVARSQVQRRSGSCANLRAAAGVHFPALSDSASRRRLNSCPKNGRFEGGQEALVCFSSTMKHRFPSVSAHSKSLLHDLPNCSSTPQPSSKPSSATVEFLLKPRRQESPAAREFSNHLPEVDNKGYLTNKSKRKSESIKVLKQRIRLFEAQEDRKIQARNKQREHDILGAACHASDNSSKQSIRLHANLKTRNQLDPLIENYKSGFVSLSKFNKSTQKPKRNAPEDLSTLTQTQQRFKEIHQQITKLKRRRLQGQKDSTELEQRLATRRSDPRLGIPGLEHPPQSFSDALNKTPEASGSIVHRQSAPDDCESSQAGLLAGTGSGRPTEKNLPIVSTVQATQRQRSLSGNTGLTEADHSDSLAGSLINNSPFERKRGFSEKQQKPVSSLAPQQRFGDTEQQKQRPNLFVETRNTPPRRPRLQKLGTIPTWNGLMDRHNPVTDRAFKHRRAKKLNLLMNIDPNRVSGELGCSKTERKLDPAKTRTARLEGSPNERVQHQTSDKTESDNISWRKVFLDNGPKINNKSKQTSIQIDEKPLNPPIVEPIVQYMPQKSEPHKPLQVKTHFLLPGCQLTSPNHSASQRPEEKSTENESDSPENHKKTHFRLKLEDQGVGVDLKPQTPVSGNRILVPKPADLWMPGKTNACGTRMSGSLLKQSALRSGNIGSDFDSPVSNCETRQQGAEIDQKSLFECFSLMYRTIFSNKQAAAARKGLHQKLPDRANPAKETAAREGPSYDNPEREPKHTDSSAEKISSRDPSRSGSALSYGAKAPAGKAPSKPQILVLQPSRKPTPALAVPIHDFGPRDPGVRQIEVDLCDSSSGSSSFRKGRRGSSRSSFSDLNGCYGKNKMN